MKKILLTFFSFIIALSTVNAQKGINFRKNYPAGGKMLMNLDSAVKNVFYNLLFPNQPFTSFNFLPEVYNVNIQIYFRKTDFPEDYRYTILEDNKPIALNKSIDPAKLKDADVGEDEILRSTTFGIFSVKNKIITIITYDIKRPQDVYKTIFYGKPIPKSKIKAFAKRFKTDKGVDYNYITDLKEKTEIKFTEKDDELTIVKDRSDNDYLYRTSIKDKQTHKTIFESNVWKNSGYINETWEFLPYVTIDKNVFKKSGDYEIIIEPLIDWTNCFDCDISSKEVEKYTSRYTLSITLDEESYTKKEFIIYGLIICAVFGAVFGATLTYIKKKEAKKLAQQFKEKETAQLQLNSVRSQLNPHFLFNALAGIQNLMNKNEIANANRYLGKFARLTRNVLDSKELISLTEEKTLLDDYLQMEQLRFGFQYKINASTDLETENIEIPAMLLQPFVENAVKYGIAEKGSEGKIEVVFEKQKSDLVLIISDNGKGFDASKTYNGLGLSLSKNRISLLNTIYKNTPFILDIQSAVNGTTVTITLTQWL